MRLPSEFRRALLKTIALAEPTPRGIRFAPEPADAHLHLELESIGDLRRWLVVLGASDEEVLIEHVDGGVRATSWVLWMHIHVRLTAQDPQGPGGGEGEQAGAVDDLADLTRLGEEYLPDPAERLAAVAAVAPAYVRPVPVPEPVGAAAVVLVDEDQAQRRVDRWAAVTSALEAGCPPPAHVDVSPDGWVLQVDLPDEAAVVAWAAQLGVADTLRSTIRKQRGVVRRVTCAGRDHPWTLNLRCTVDVAGLLPAPLADDIGSLAWPERAGRALAVAA
ncbi:hypothetical protein [Phytohabitans aurantiacus]|uniref:Uncharacterized protein n=1 Tax=Phytohabitans aurantiacus TaxID=3016789 RepID=A0ABQ5QN19_9ACTN|nr:hypothetical protein [Phytohabitans aurantiacus]GLH94926.1 hypothetical protein Pa4123_01980 [Phytohabitans aurantiacus]